jgi:hypothetical protein
MMRSRMLPLSLFALVVSAGAALAQVAIGSPTLNGWTSGNPLHRRSIVHVSAYSASPYFAGAYASLAEPIFMTTINTPGIYGAYSYGTGGITLTREPRFYPVIDDRENIPALDITSAPVRYLRTPTGSPTMAVGLPAPSPRMEYSMRHSRGLQLLVGLRDDLVGLVHFPRPGGAREDIRRRVGMAQAAIIRDLPGRVNRLLGRGRGGLLVESRPAVVEISRGDHRSQGQGGEESLPPTAHASPDPGRELG